jgi:hypothetical protein
VFFKGDVTTYHHLHPLLSTSQPSPHLCFTISRSSLRFHYYFRSASVLHSTISHRTEIDEVKKGQALLECQRSGHQAIQAHLCRFPILPSNEAIVVRSWSTINTVWRPGTVKLMSSEALLRSVGSESRSCEAELRVPPCVPLLAARLTWAWRTAGRHHGRCTA